MVQRGLGGRQDRRPQARTQVYLWEGQVHHDHHTSPSRQLPRKNAEQDEQNGRVTGAQLSSPYLTRCSSLRPTVRGGAAVRVGVDAGAEEPKWGLQEQQLRSAHGSQWLRQRSTRACGSCVAPDDCGDTCGGPGQGDESGGESYRWLYQLNGQSQLTP